MKKTKQILAVIITVIMVMTLGISPVYAVDILEPNKDGIIEIPNRKYQQQLTLTRDEAIGNFANILKELGLFKGTDKGFELDREPSRTEGLVMLIRLLGEEDEALSSNLVNPFKDVPQWADKYVAYAYDKGYTAGTSKTTFGATDKLTNNQFATFVLRALGYSDKNGDFSWDKAMNTLVENTELKAEIQRRAEVLKEVGLFIGTDKGFELDREPNRTEGLIMLIRLLGEETEALKAEINHPFTDVPKWADAYISYAYQKGYTKGMSNTIFGSDLKITAKQYVTFILRALRYNESDGDFEYNYAMYAAENIALIKDASLYENRVFTRGDLAYLSYGALQLHVNDKDYIDYYGYPYSLGFYFLLQFYDNSHDEFLRMGEIMVNDGLTPDIHLKERYYTPDIRPDQNRINTNNILKTKLVYKNKIVYSEGEYYSAEFEISDKKIVGKIKDNVGNKTYKVSLMYKDTDRTYIELLNEYSDTKSNNNGTMLFNVNLPTKQMNEVLEERDNLYDISDVPSPFVLRIYLRISTTNYSIMKSIPIERDGDKYVFRLDSLEDWNNKKYSAAKPVEYYLTARDNILPNNKLIKETTNSIVSSSDNNYDKAFKIFQWAISNTKYSQNFSLNPDDMLKEKKASGIGLSNLVVSMLNSQDIPARVVVGQERINDGDLTYDKLYANHRWVEFYYDNRWVVMDTNYRVEDIKGNYISNFDISKDYMNILYKITEFK